eukprot:794889-Rhodomonas_salina.1
MPYSPTAILCHPRYWPSVWTSTWPPLRREIKYKTPESPHKFMPTSAHGCLVVTYTPKSNARNRIPGTNCTEMAPGSDLECGVSRREAEERGRRGERRLERMVVQQWAEVSGEKRRKWRGEGGRER